MLWAIVLYEAMAFWNISLINGRNEDLKMEMSNKAFIFPSKLHNLVLPRWLMPAQTLTGCLGLGLWRGLLVTTCAPVSFEMDSCFMSINDILEGHVLIFLNPLY